MACYQADGPVAVRNAFSGAVGITPNHYEWHSARDRGASDIRLEQAQAKKAGLKVPPGPKSIAEPEEAVSGVFAMYESLGFTREQAWEQPGAFELITSLHDGKIQMRRAQVAGLKYLKSEASRKIEALPAHRIVVNGRMTRETLDRAIYGGWQVERIEERQDYWGEKSITAILRAPVDQPSGFGSGPMADRLRSFGSVSAREISPDSTTPSVDTLERISHLTGIKQEDIKDGFSEGQAEVLAMDAEYAFNTLQQEYVNIENAKSAPFRMEVDDSEALYAREYAVDLLSTLGVKKADLENTVDKMIRDAVDSYDPTPY